MLPELRCSRTTTWERFAEWSPLVRRPGLAFQHDQSLWCGAGLPFLGQLLGGQRTSSLLTPFTALSAKKLLPLKLGLPRHKSHLDEKRKNPDIIRVFLWFYLATQKGLEPSTSAVTGP